MADVWYGPKTQLNVNITHRTFSNDCVQTKQNYSQNKRLVVYFGFN